VGVCPLFSLRACCVRLDAGCFGRGNGCVRLKPAATNANGRGNGRRNGAGSGPAAVAAGRGWRFSTCKFRREAPGMVLGYRIDRPGPPRPPRRAVSVEDCADMKPGAQRDSRRRGRGAEAYTLEVSCPDWTGRAPRGRLPPLRGADGEDLMRQRVDGQGFSEQARGPRGTDVLIEADDRKTHRRTARSDYARESRSEF